MSDRLFFKALLYLVRTGIPWRDLPAEFGSWLAVYHWFRHWLDSGRLFRLFELRTQAPESGIYVWFSSNR